MSGGLIHQLWRPRMFSRDQLESICSNAVIGADGKPFNRGAFEKGPKGFEKLLAEATSPDREVKLALSDDGCPVKFSAHTLTFMLWRGELCRETHRILENGNRVTVKGEGQLISETARNGEAHDVTAWFGIMEELLPHLRKYRVTVSPKELRFIGGGVWQRARPSTVYIGWRSVRLVFRAIWDVSYLKEKPWPDGLDFEDTGTQLHAEWEQADPKLLAEIAMNEEALKHAPKHQPTIYVGG